MIFTKMCVKSSSDLCWASCFTEGLTAGGGTDNTWQIIQSGLENTGLNPIKLTSSSEIRLNILRTISAVNFMTIGSPVTLSFHSANTETIPLSFLIFGFTQPHPFSVSSPQAFISLAISNTYFHLASLSNSKACLYFSLLINNLLHLKHTHFNIFKIVGIY